MHDVPMQRSKQDPGVECTVNETYSGALMCAYGLNFVGIGSQGGGRGPTGCEEVHVSVSLAGRAESLESCGQGDPGSVRFSADDASLMMPEGLMTVRRVPRYEIQFDLTSSLNSEAFVHPYLAFPGALIQHWIGNTSFHAGCIRSQARALGVIGEKAAGKSTTMVAAACRGVEVVTDDLLVVEGRTALAGPRCIDLRAESAARWGGRALGVVGARERFRIDLPPVADRTPLAGFVRLGWGEELSVTRLGFSEVIPLLFDACALGLGPARPDHFMELGDLPVWQVNRPQDLSSMDDTLDALLQLLEQ